jgi:hypothetical protein
MSSVNDDIKAAAQDIVRNVGGRLLAASQDDREQFEDWLATFGREVMIEIRKLLPTNKADKAFDAYRRKRLTGSDDGNHLSAGELPGGDGQRTSESNS